MFCDPTLKPAMRRLDGISRMAAGAPVAVLSAPAASMLAQITRHTRNDVLFTLSAAMDQAVALKLVKPETRVDGFSNTLVLAGLGDRMSPPDDLAGVRTMLGKSIIAVTDNTVASGLDGRAVLAANGLTAGGGQFGMGGGQYRRRGVSGGVRRGGTWPDVSDRCARRSAACGNLDIAGGPGADKLRGGGECGGDQPERAGVPESVCVAVPPAAGCAMPG